MLPNNRAEFLEEGKSFESHEHHYLLILPCADRLFAYGTWPSDAGESEQHRTGR